MIDTGAPSTPEAAWTVFVDFDGTITNRDTFDVLVREIAGEDVWHETQAGLDDGTASLRDVLERQASYVRGTFDEVAARLRAEIAVDPTFVTFAARARARGIPVIVLSSGIAPIIRDRLARVGLGDLPVIANDVRALPAGWKIVFRDTVGNGTDKAAFVRAARARGSRTVFVGDGHSDFDAALAADRRFAKSGLALARFLRERDVDFRSFASFDEIDLELPAAPQLECSGPAGGI
ncbi:MAG: MtnX-like HAD-IB family phosphatase [Vulcanimicrobiaceae bacterium]